MSTQNDIFKEAKNPSSLEGVVDWIEDIKEILEKHVKNKKWLVTIKPKDKDCTKKLLEVIKDLESKNKLKEIRASLKNENYVERAAGLGSLVATVNSFTAIIQKVKNEKNSIIKGKYFTNGLTGVRKKVKDEMKKISDHFVTNKMRDDYEAVEAMFKVIKVDGLGDLEKAIGELRKEVKESEGIKEFKKNLEDIPVPTEVDYIPGWLRSIFETVKSNFKNSEYGKELEGNEKNGVCKILKPLQAWSKPKVKNTLKNNDIVSKMVVDSLEKLFNEIDSIALKAPDNSILASEWFSNSMASIKKIVRVKKEELKDIVNKELKESNLSQQKIDQIEKITDTLEKKSNLNNPETIIKSGEKLDKKIEKLEDNNNNK